MGVFKLQKRKDSIYDPNLRPPYLPSVTALYDEAVKYYSGDGAEKNFEKAFGLFMQAAEKNHLDAQCNVGACYKRGAGVQKNNEKAVEWYLKAASQGFAPAQYLLAACYERGEGAPKSYKDAKHWYKTAISLGYKEAESGLRLLEEDRKRGKI